MNLSDVLSRLYASEINCGMQSFWDAGWDVWIGDEANGKRAIARSLNVDEIPEWLHSAALEHFPQSAYAREERATDLVGGQAP